MAILSLQRRLAEVGRIRLGQQIESKSGKKRPAALTTFRLTSGDRARIEQAAKLYGGQVTKWEAPSGLPAWEVITKADKLPVIVPPSQMAFSQHYELWSAGGCQRRCDGVTETLSEQPCLCDPDNRQCEIHTRLSVMLSEMSGLGVWRVDTQGYYAAVELQGSVEVIALAAGKGQMLPATLRLDPRSIKREGEGTKKFVVPVLDIDISPAQLLMGTVGTVDTTSAPAAIPERARTLTPVPEVEAAPPSIAEQMKASEQQPSRRRAAPIPSTGIAPRNRPQPGTFIDRGQPDPYDAAAQDQAQSAANDDEPARPTWEQDAWRNRRMADQFGLCIPEGTPGFPYDGDAPGTGLRIDAYDAARQQQPISEQQQAAIDGAVQAGREHAERVREEQQYAAIDAAREAAETTQDQPRMCTRPQLQKLGILLGKQGFDKTDEGRAARMDFCTAALKELVHEGKMTAQPWTGRVLKSSTELTFEEAHHLIDLLESEEKASAKREEKPVQPETGPNDSETDTLETNADSETDPAETNADTSDTDADTATPAEPEPAPEPPPAEPDPDDRSPGPNQLDLLGQ